MTWYEQSVAAGWPQMLPTGNLRNRCAALHQVRKSSGLPTSMHCTCGGTSSQCSSACCRHDRCEQQHSAVAEARRWWTWMPQWEWCCYTFIFKMHNWNVDTRPQCITCNDMAYHKIITDITINNAVKIKCCITASRTSMSSTPIVKPRNWRKQVNSRARLDRSLPAVDPPYSCKTNKQTLITGYVNIWKHALLHYTTKKYLMGPSWVCTRK